MAASSSPPFIDPNPARLQRIKRSFSELESCHGMLESCYEQCKELEKSCRQIQRAIENRFQELKAKEVEGKKEAAISEQERASIAEIEARKDAILAGLAMEKSRWKKGGAHFVKDVEPPKRNNFRPHVVVNPKIQSFFDKMNGKGLRNYLVEHRRDRGGLGSLFKEVLCALHQCTHPASMVFGAMDGCHDIDLDPNPNKENRGSAVRRVCISLLAALSLVFADPVLGENYTLVPPKVKAKAKKIAIMWRERMDIRKNGAKVHPLDVQLFLQFLVTFGIATEFEADYLIELIVVISRRKTAPAFCRYLGLSARVPDLLNKLSKDARQLDALCFANDFGLMDKIKPVPLLKRYLKDIKRAAKLEVKNGPNDQLLQLENNAISRELNALTSVLKAVVNYKLESEYPIHTLHQRIKELEKEQDKRRSAATTTTAKKVRVKDRPENQSTSVASFAGTTPRASTAMMLAPLSPVLAGTYGALNERGLFGAASTTYGHITANNYDRQLEPNLVNHALLPSSLLYSSDGIKPSTLSASLDGYQYTSALASASYLSSIPSIYQGFTL